MEVMDTNRRAELTAFLRSRRARLSPRQAGLPAAGAPGRRRTPGLRRQEVAQLAGLSVDYYIRLEQARGLLAGTGKDHSRRPVPGQAAIVCAPYCFPPSRSTTRRTFSWA